MRYCFVTVALILVASVAAATGRSAEPRGTNPMVIIETYAGTGLPALGDDGVHPTLSELYLPLDVTVGPDGFTYIVDWNNHRIRVVQNNIINTIVGTGLLGDAQPGFGDEIGLNHPTHVSFDPSGDMIITAWHNSKVLHMDMTTQWVEPIVGWAGARGFFGDGGPAIDAIVNIPSSSIFDQQGIMYISDQANQRIRHVDLNDIIDTVIGNGTRGFCGDGGPAIDACLNNPVGQTALPAGKITFDLFGNLYIADTGNHCVRKVDTNGIITTIAGTPQVPGFSGDGGPALQALLDNPSDVAIGGDGHLYIADRLNQCIRKVDLNTFVISTVAGQGDQPGFGGDGGDPTLALLHEPFGIAFDIERRDLYIADTKNHRIRIVRTFYALPTVLHDYDVRVDRDAVVVEWTLSEAGHDMTFDVHRAGADATRYERLPSPVARNGLTFTVRDEGIAPGERYRYRVSVTDDTGTFVLFETPVTAVPTPIAELRQNHPNPFNPSTVIEYSLAEPAHVRLNIYNAAGELVVSLIDGARGAGGGSALWDGTNGDGKGVGNGVYFCRLTAGSFVQTRKMVLLK
jgi:hypothetical protein